MLLKAVTIEVNLNYQKCSLLLGQPISVNGRFGQKYLLNKCKFNSQKQTFKN